MMADTGWTAQKQIWVCKFLWLLRSLRNVDRFKATAPKLYVAT